MTAGDVFMIGGAAAGWAALWIIPPRRLREAPSRRFTPPVMMKRIQAFLARQPPPPIALKHRLINALLGGRSWRRV